MQKKNYSINVEAPALQAYDIMLGLSNKKSYEAWTAVFNASSTFEGSWDKGAKILFIGTGADGKRGGMVSEIAENQPGSFVSIRHIGMLEGDNEITEGPQVEAWSGSHENYTFTESNGITNITVEVDVVEEYADYFNNTYPNALIKLKEIIEK